MVLWTNCIFSAGHSVALRSSTVEGGELFYALEAQGVSPLAHQGDDRSALPMVSGRVLHVALGCQTLGLTGLTPGFRGAAVVREHPPAINPLTKTRPHPDQEPTIVNMFYLGMTSV
jgi:hypothetical protein